MATKSKNETKETLLTAMAAWEQLAPNDEFAGYTLVQFKALVEPSLEARRRLDELDLEFNRWLVAREQADDHAWGEYLKVIHGMRAHPKHGDNAAIIRAQGYITDMDRASGLTRVSPAAQPDTATTSTTATLNPVPVTAAG